MSDIVRNFIGNIGVISCVLKRARKRRRNEMTVVLATVVFTATTLLMV